MSELKIEYVDIDELKGWPRNAKLHDIPGIKKSVREFGFNDAVCANLHPDAMFLLEGHGRLETLVEMREEDAPAPEGIVVVEGKWLVPVVYLNLPPGKAEAYAIVHNSLTTAGGWDLEKLSAVIVDLSSQEFEDYNFDLVGMGWDGEEMAALLGDGGGGGGTGGGTNDPGPQISRAEELQKEWGTEAGQLWELGRHRIICGDCRDEELLQRLMDGAKADMIWTDPPYGVSYVGKTKAELTIDNDGSEGLETLLTPAFKSVAGSLIDRAPFYICAPAGPMGTVFRLCVANAGWQFHECLVWVKNSMVLGYSDYHYRHEDLLYGWLPGQGRAGRGNHDGTKWYGDHSQTSVLEFNRPTKSEDHPTMKPVDLITYCLSNSSPPDGKVLDPFIGSGSTLIACEETGRSCFGVELSPGYLAVILQRFKDATGTEPSRLSYVARTPERTHEEEP